MYKRQVLCAACLAGGMTGCVPEHPDDPAGDNGDTAGEAGILNNLVKNFWQSDKMCIRDSIPYFSMKSLSDVTS